MAVDLAELILATLQSSVDVSALVTSGANNILEIGQFRATDLVTAEATRRTAAGTGVLGVTVQDAGEVRLRGLLFNATVIVRPLDRLQGYTAIRAVREEIIKAARYVSGALDDGGVVSTSLAARTGHKVDSKYAVDFESITFTAVIERKEEVS